MIGEYIFQAGMERAEIIDKTLWSILKTCRPKTFVLLNALRWRWRWLWMLAGIRVETVYKNYAYEEYRVFQFDELLATFAVKRELKIV
jgi:hypothetical protein